MSDLPTVYSGGTWLKNLLNTILAAVNGLNNLSTAQVNAEADTALDTAIPASNTADSVNDILLDQLKPRLPGAGVIQTAYFRKGVAATLVFPIYDKSGALVGGAAGLDSEISKDGGNFADCTNEAQNITSGGSNTGIYSLALTAEEMNADIIVIQTKTSTTDARPTVTVIYPGA